MNEYIRTSRTKVRIPSADYKTLNELALLLDIPTATLLTIAMWNVYETIDKKHIEANKPRKWKNEEDKCELNIFVPDQIKDEIYKIERYPFNEFVIDCIRYLSDQEFKNILLYKGKYFGTAKRIQTSVNIGTGTKNDGDIDGDIDANIEKRYTDRYSEDVKKKYPYPSIKEYIKNKADYYGTSRKGLSNYYIAREINRIIEDDIDQQDIYTNPKDYNFDE